MEKLKNILAQPDTVLFIGSGLSLWSGLPTWYGLIDELAKFIEKNGMNAELIRAESSRGDLLQAASYGFDKLTKYQIGDFIRSACRYGIAKPHEIHRKVALLGPRCFVTTNYDDLIEQSLRTWQPERFYGLPKTNRNLTETADIIHAKAIDFIFKPHGDAGDSDSIILTREQYRRLLPQGELYAALESLKTILVSRPVVYIGFGLRDPDFLYVRDLLANIYKGATRDHYAIMADVSEQEKDYWRKYYGIHLINYSTCTRPDNSKDHSPILNLLDELLQAPAIQPKIVTFDADASDVRLSLARHAAALARSPSVNPEYTIRVSRDLKSSGGTRYMYDKFSHNSVENFLDFGPDRTILTGLPGAGKTYSLRRAAARLAEKLHDSCLAEKFIPANVVIPIFIDLKLYKGSLVDLIDQTLPTGISLKNITIHFKCRIFLDSFNEMPREFWEDGSYEVDFREFNTLISQASLVIGSRTDDGLRKLDFPIYSLDQLDEVVVAAELVKMNVDMSGRFDAELRRLLQKPFYFQLLTNGMVSIPKEPNPKDFYESMFDNLQHAFVERFRWQFDLETALSTAAYTSMDRGEEAYPLVELLKSLQNNIEGVRISEEQSRDVANWLVSKSILIPYSGARISFVHQSITEFLAAKKLAQYYIASHHLLLEKLTLKRWDQALFLALNLLPTVNAKVFFEGVVNFNFILALNAIKYLETGCDEIVSRLLDEIPRRMGRDFQNDMDIAWNLERNVPLSYTHATQLRSILRLRGVVGGAAASRLHDLYGSEIKDELLALFLDARSDYNFCCNGIGKILLPLASENDISKILAMAELLEDEVNAMSDEHIILGFTCGTAKFLSEIDISKIRAAFFPNGIIASVPEIHARILCNLLQEHQSTSSLEFAGDLLLGGVNGVTSAIRSIAVRPDNLGNFSWASFSIAHVKRLVEILEIPLTGSSALEALKALCHHRQDLAMEVQRYSELRFGIVKAALLHCALPMNDEPVFDAYGELLLMNIDERQKIPINLIQYIDVNWSGRETVFVEILKLRDKNIAMALLNAIFSDFGNNPFIDNLKIGPIDWWLDWLNEEDEFFFRDRLAGLLSSNVDDQTRNEFLIEFNKSDSKYRKILAYTILLEMNELTTNDFSEDAISFLLENLRDRNDLIDWRGHLLGAAASEQFVNERLAPLLSEKSDVFSINLRKVLRQAGGRHGRRYCSDTLE